MAIAMPPMAAAMARNALGFFCAQSANFCKIGRAASTTGSRAAPMLSFVSATLLESIFILPAAVSAAADAAPPNVPPKTSITVFRSAPSLISAAISGVRLRNALKLPCCALAKASATVVWSSCRPVEMSRVRLIRSCAACTSLVPRTSAAIAGRNWSSATPVARDIAPMKSSVCLTCAALAPALFSNARASWVCAAASSIAALVASPNANAKPPMAAAAGMAAFLIANCALAPTPSSCLNCLMACLTPLPSNSLMMGIDRLTGSPGPVSH